MREETLVTLGGEEFRQPDGTAFQDGEEFYMPNLFNPTSPIRGIWPLYIPVHGWMYLIHKRKEDAILHAMGLSKVNSEACQASVAGDMVEEIISNGEAEHEAS